MNAIAPNKVTFLDSTPEQRREVLYRCAEALLHGLLNGAGESEKQALFQSLEHLGIAEIRSLNASAGELKTRSTGTVQTQNNSNKDFFNHVTTRTNAQATGVDGLSQPACDDTLDAGIAGRG